MAEVLRPATGAGHRLADRAKLGRGHDGQQEQRLLCVHDLGGAPAKPATWSRCGAASGVTRASSAPSSSGPWLNGVNTILIEKAGPGLHLVQELRHNGDACVPAPIGIQPEGDKLSRTEAQLTDFESGRVLLPRHAPWLGEFLNELLAFPNSRHDDQVDSVTQFLGWQRGRQRRHRRISTVAPILVTMEG